MIAGPIADRSGGGVGLREESTELRLNNQRLQDVVGHKQRARLFRLADAGDRASTVTVQADVLKTRLSSRNVKYWEADTRS